MKKFICIILFSLISISYLFSNEVEVIYDDSLTAEEICAIRGHTVIVYNVYRENVVPWFEDFPDSTVLYWYDDNIQEGEMYFCTRYRQWIGIPKFEEPNKKIVWRKNDEKIKNSISVPDNTDNK